MIGELIFHGALFVGMLFLYINTFTFTQLSIGGTIGPAGWPRAILLISMVLTLVSAYSTYKKGTKVVSGQQSDNGKSKENMGRFFTAMGAFLIFLLILPYLGFLFAFPLILGFYIWYLGIRKPLPLVLNTIIITLVFGYLFGAILYVVLPRGVGIFRVLSYYIY